MRDIDYIAIHCSATPSKMDIGVEKIREWHKQRGFNDVGYHYIVRRDGSIELGRNIKKIGAHVKGYNSNSIGICYVGGVDVNNNPEDNRTDAQKATLIMLLDMLQIFFPLAKIQGHRDFKGVTKACPCFDVKNEYK